MEPAHADAAPLVLAHRQFDTLRLHLIKLAVRVVEMKTQVKLHLPSKAPCQSILAFVLGRMPRLIS